MRIVLTTESYWPNVDGGAVFERNLAHALVNVGHEVNILAPKTKGRKDIEKDNGTTIYRLKAYPIPFATNYKITLFPYLAVKKILNKLKPDVIHSHAIIAGIGQASLRIARQMKIPVVATNHIMPENLLMYISKFKWLMHVLKEAMWKNLVKVHNKCDFVTSPTQTALNYLTQRGLIVPHKPISNGINLNVFKPRNFSEIGDIKNKYHLPDKPIILYTGRISGEKSIDVLIKALPYVFREIDAHFAMTGEGREKKNIIKLVEKLGIKEKASFLGFVPSDEFPMVYNCASVFAISSTAELQSIVLMEALASGLPAVAVNSGALPELVHDGKNGFLFEVGDSKEMAQKLVTILGDEKLRNKMSGESLKIISEHDFKKTLDQYLECYNEAIEEIAFRT